MPVTKRMFLEYMESVAPAELCESWDNVGLLVDAGNESFSRVLLALDPTQAVAREAVERGCDLLLTHHPILLKGIKRISQSDPEGLFISTLLKGGVSHFAAHTNLDSAKEGVNALLARKLGLINVEVLQAAPRNAKKIVVYVPSDAADNVFDAMCGAGAGRIGDYSRCSFRSGGEGTFFPHEGTNPTVGAPGVFERTAEVRLETVAPAGKVRDVLCAMLRAHPYEEPAFDVYPLELIRKDEGMGRVGSLQEPRTLALFAQDIKEALGIERVVFAGSRDQLIRTVAVCGGSGSDLIDVALSKKADVLVTGDVRHHQALYAMEKGIALIDAGHFATEAPIINVLFECLQEQFDQVQYHIEFFVSRAEVSAMQSI